MKDKYNLEEQLANKLGNRSIAPGGEAWERIARNREQGKDKKKKKRTYLYYAASIVLLMLFGGYFFATVNNHIEAGPQVVTSESIEKTEKIKDAVDAPEFALPGQKSETVMAHKLTEPKEDVVNRSKEEVKMIAESYRGLQVNESLPHTSVAVLAEVKTITKDKLYDQEVDYLLKNAFKEVAADKQLSKPTDNTALLKEVEAEMDEYYRDKAMSIFSLRHKKIRIAVRE
jgi:hypothetical protein